MSKIPTVAINLPAINDLLSLYHEAVRKNSKVQAAAAENAIHATVGAEAAVAEAAVLTTLANGMA